MDRIDNLNVPKHVGDKMLKPPRLEGVVQNLGIKNKKKINKSNKQKVSSK